jgi:hypothetical protein
VGACDNKTGRSARADNAVGLSAKRADGEVIRQTAKPGGCTEHAKRGAIAAAPAARRPVQEE